MPSGPKSESGNHSLRNNTQKEVPDVWTLCVCKGAYVCVCARARVCALHAITEVLGKGTWEKTNPNDASAGEKLL